MNATIIISVYKNVENLKAILDALRHQSVNGFEVIISEDGESLEMLNFVSLYFKQFNLDAKHVTQKDEGWKKTKALNNAVQNSSGEYLIFIDGDCVPHYKFVEEHLRNAEKNKILMGTRVMLGDKHSNILKEEGMFLFSRKYGLRLLEMAMSKTKFVGKGIYLGANPFKFYLKKNNKSKGLVGCNMSFYKEAIMAINGFDEDYVSPAVGEDDDLVWRFEGLGYSFKSVKNLAIVYHLHHEKNWSSSELNVARMKNNQLANRFICRNGISK